MFQTLRGSGIGFKYLCAPERYIYCIVKDFKGHRNCGGLWAAGNRSSVIVILRRKDKKFPEVRHPDRMVLRSLMIDCGRFWSG